MGTLKEDLKAAATFLKSGENEKAMEILQEYVKEESPPYQVLCFIACAYSNIKDFQNSYKMYKRAVEIDELNAMAWKGLFKLFEVKSCVNPDQFSLLVCEFIQRNEDGKKLLAVKVHRRLLLEMELWKDVLENFEHLQFSDDSELLRKLIKVLSNQKNQEINKNLLEKCFSALTQSNMLESDENTMLLFCKFNNSVDSVIRLAHKYPGAISDTWVQKKLFEFYCQQYFENGKFPKFDEHMIVTSPVTMNIVNALKENDIPAALEAFEEVSDHSIYPDCILYVRLLAETERWHIVEKLNTFIYKLFPSATCNGWIARSLFATDPECIGKIQELGPLPHPEFAVEEMKVAIFSGNIACEKALLDEYSSDTELGIVLRLTKLLLTNGEVSAEQLNLAELLTAFPRHQNLVLAAEIRIRAGLDANTLLVKAAKINVRCSRAFFLLGNAVLKKNPAKAKSLIERAVQILPSSEEYTKSLNDLLINRGAPLEDRLNVLKNLMSEKKNRPKPYWLSDALSTIYMNLSNFTEAIDELQQMVRHYKDNKNLWARLADAYTRKGHHRAAVSAYAQLAEMEGGHEFAIPTARVLLQLREYDEALEKIVNLRQKITAENLQCCSETPIVMNFTEAEIRLNIHENICGKQKLLHLKEALKLLTRCVDKEGNCKYAIVFKLLGDTLLIASKYAKRVLPCLEIEEKWQVHSPLECVKKSVSFYMAVLRSQSRDAIAWYDVSMSLLAKFKLEKDAQILPKVQRMLEHALTLTTVETLLSSIWTLLAEAKRLEGQPWKYQLHCLSRALQLSKANDAAWLKVAVLCLEACMFNEASRVLEQTIKYNPHNSDAWCTWAQTAHFLLNNHETLAMFRQALFVRPIPSAVVGYSTYLCDSLKKRNTRFDSATAALDFEPIIDLMNLAAADDNILYHLGLLADLFGWYPESYECYQLCQKTDISDEIMLAQIKASILYPNDSTNITAEKLGPTNVRIGGMLHSTCNDSYSFLTAETEVYNKLYHYIESNNHDEFKKLYMSCVKEISVPLFISGIIIKRFILSTEIIRAIHDAVPRHELVDFFPTVLPEEMDNGLRHLEQDGEEPFRYRHRSAHRLLGELKNLRNQLEEKKQVSNSKDDENLTILQT